MAGKAVPTGIVMTDLESFSGSGGIMLAGVWGTKGGIASP